MIKDWTPEELKMLISEFRKGKDVSYFLSEDEIHRIIKELEAEEKNKDLEYNNPFVGYLPVVKEKVHSIDGKCINHKWIPYTGLIEKFEHCEICGAKK